MVARASASPAPILEPPSPLDCPPPAQEEREMTERERELVLRCVRLIQGKPAQQKDGQKENALLSAQDASPGCDEGCADMTASMISGGSIELCSPERDAGKLL